MRELAATNRDEKLLKCVSGVELLETEFTHTWSILVTVATNGQVSLASVDARRWVQRPDGREVEAEVAKAIHKDCFGKALRGLRVKPPTRAAHVMWEISISRSWGNPFY